MIQKTGKCMIGNIITVTICTLISLIWSFFVLNFLRENIMVNVYHVIGMCAVTVVASCCCYRLTDFFVSKFKNDYLMYLIALILFTVVYIVFVVKTPYSPNHDSYDLEYILKVMKSGAVMGDYLKAYMNFFVTNKLVIYIYYPFVYFAKTVETGVRAANGLFIWIATVCISCICGKIRNIKSASMSLIVMIFLCPVLLLSGPYIYPPAIMLSGLGIILYMNKNVLVRVFGYLFAGILFTVRPLSLGVFLVFAVCDIFYNSKTTARKIVYTLVNTLLVFTVCFAAQWYIGQIMYVTEGHPLKNLNSAMGLWTIEVGTRNQGENTGFCEYSPGGLSEDKTDSISQNFADLWYLYLEPEQNTYEINELKDRISGKLRDRIKSEIIDSKESFFDFFKTKYTNYYRDYYKPYFFAVNINAENREELLVNNYDYRYSLYENTLLALFYFIGIFGSIVAYIGSLKGKRSAEKEYIVVFLFLGVICTSLVSILVTEVGKRLIFDSFVPICVVISTSISYIDSKKDTEKKVQKFIAPVLLILLCLFMHERLLDEIQIPIFKNCKVEINEKRDVFIQFDERISSGEYIYITPESEEFSMKDWDALSVAYNSDVYEARPVLFGVRLPDKQHVYISYLE